MSHHHLDNFEIAEALGDAGLLEGLTLNNCIQRIQQVTGYNLHYITTAVKNAVCEYSSERSVAVAVMQFQPHFIGTLNRNVRQLLQPFLAWPNLNYWGKYSHLQPEK